LTTKSGNGLASNVSSSKCAYLAGSVVVILDVNSGTQSHLIASETDRLPLKPLSCVALSQDGRFVAAGEVRINAHILIMVLVVVFCIE
jgi:mitogen-activated protein kinase binding protein 1